MRRSAFIRGRTLQTRFRWRCAISAPSSAPIDLLQQRDLWQPPPSSVAPIPDLPALTPERGSSTVSGNSARRYKIQTPVTPGLFRVPVRKRARQAVTAFGDDEAGGPEHDPRHRHHVAGGEGLQHFEKLAPVASRRGAEAREEHDPDPSG